MAPPTQLLSGQYNRTAVKDFIIVANGPGELAGWAVPVAETARAVAEDPPGPLRLVLVLPPCQFSSGQEEPFAASLGLFDRIVGPWECLRMVAGLRRMARAGTGAVLHIGGDLWYAAALARRLGYPAFAYVEVAFGGRRYRPFRRVFVPSERVASRLQAAGVTRDRIEVVGDLRVDALTKFRMHDADGAAPLEATGAPGGRSAPLVTLVPGGRARLFELGLPYFLEVARRLREGRPDVRVALAISPFLPPAMVRAMFERHGPEADALGVIRVHRGQWDVVGRSDLAITIPGTTTVEMAILGVPALVIMPTQHPDRIPAEGVLGLVARIPGAARLLAPVAIPAILRRVRYIAQPNRTAGREIMPEMIGDLNPAAVAEAALALLEDDGRRRAMAEDLRRLYAGQEGAARRVVEGVREALA
ncbi:MAG: hypothetical protein HY660_03370 [Armatimonadetes bacterium]|nr:hypothetical protein [Armatimonadota bacterium]